jgi:protein phosphatase
MCRTRRGIKERFAPESAFLRGLGLQLNAAVVARQRELCTERMGTTMAAFCFSHGYVYVCNLGDSRAYRLREGEFMQLSADHVEKREGQTKKKAPLTQHLGIAPEEFLIEPYIAKGEIKSGDQYLLCSDGLTDMLSNLEIDEIMTGTDTAESCVQKLVDAALKKGGRDNVTAIVCRIL